MGLAGSLLEAHAAVSSSISVAMKRLVRMRLLFLPQRRGEPLDEASWHIGFDDHFPVGRDVADHPRHTIHPSDLLAIEVLAAVERDGDSSRVESESRGD